VGYGAPWLPGGVQYDSYRLVLAHRSHREVAPDFVLTPDNRPDLMARLRTLDGGVGMPAANNLDRATKLVEMTLRSDSGDLLPPELRMTLQTSMMQLKKSRVPVLAANQLDETQATDAGGANIGVGAYNICSPCCTARAWTPWTGGTHTKHRFGAVFATRH
jgi:hypothetical protein